jgi:hypothetical protein
VRDKNSSSSMNQRFLIAGTRASSTWRATRAARRLKRS